MNIHSESWFIFISLVLLLTLGCNSGQRTAKNVSKETKQEEAKTSLQSAYGANFMMGAAVNDSHINGTDTLALKLIEQEFNTITPENIMKWMYIHPAPDSFYFEMADKYIELGQKNKMHIVGHTLVWHSQIADWMNEVKDKKTMADHIEKHIKTIVGRYKGKIDTWDVVNEALNEDGSFRASNFYKVMGDSYIEQAFKVAAEVDPNADLIYNDYNLWKPEKRDGVVRMVKALQDKGIKIDGIGMQGHYSLIGPEIKDVENSILAFSELGLKVGFTELDVTTLPNPWDLEGAEVSQNYENYEGDPTMNPYPSGLPDSMQIKMADRYEDLFQLFLKHDDKINRITFWGVNNGHSWLNNWPIKNRTNYPLLFDRNFNAQKAYDRVIKLKQ